MVTIGDIQNAVSAYFGLQPGDLLSHRRPKKLALARQIAMYLSRILTESSFPEIAEEFGRDHATVIHAFRKIENLRKYNKKVELILEELKKSIACKI